MGKLIYSAIASLDGYVADPDGHFESLAPDEEVHRFVNDLERPIGTHLYGRRMYETLAVWEHPEGFVGDSEVMRDYAAIWQAADKVVYSRTLEQVSSSRTRIERNFEPDAVRALKEAADRDVAIGGPEIAAQALAVGLVDECQLFLSPVVMGGGHPAFAGGARAGLELLDERRFAGGVVFVRYRTR
jgi:dihydrofolate reductase